MKLDLVAPDERYRESFLRALQEFRAEGLPWWCGADTDLALRDFAAFVAAKRAEARGATPNGVPKSQYWAVSGGQIVGRIGLFHALTEALRREGGHVGYDTLPSLRGRGIATEMLLLALPRARALGLRELLLTCNDDNAASIRVIEKSGGVLREIRTLEESGRTKRYYWIAL